MSYAKEIVACGHWAEFPDVLVTLELCRMLAQREKRRVGESLRACARQLQIRVKEKRLRATLEEMSKSPFPEVQIIRIRDCIRRMEGALNKNFNTKDLVA